VASQNSYFGHQQRHLPPNLIGGQMPSTTELRPAVTSSLADLRGVPLGEVAVLTEPAFDEAIMRILPESPVAPVPVAAFQSAI
jgi:FXSXX-COOH protein